ncbi:MAG: CvpA family protein [Planctomycetota bacterium]|jgi:hypothetical protein
MWFSLFILVLVLAITFYQGLQGVFSASITCILTILCAALAFGVYEDIYFAQLISYQPDHGRAIGLLGVFIVSLLVLRTLVDQLITKNMQFQVYVDRIGGGLFGFMTSMVTVGMLAIGFQMLPFGSRILGFTRYVIVDSEDSTKVIPLDDPTAEQEVKRADIDWSKVKRVRQDLCWLFTPDSFVAGFISHLSNCSLAGRNRFKDIYPDFIDSLHRMRAGQSAGSQMTAKPDSLQVKGYWYLKNEDFYIPQRYEDEGKDKIRLRPAEDTDLNKKRLAIRAVLSDKGADSDGQHRFTTEQVRLAARDRKGGDPKEYLLAGINEIEPLALGKLIKVYPGEGFSRVPPGTSANYTFVFEIPDRDYFEPLYLEYKLNARAEIRSSQALGQGEAPGRIWEGGSGSRGGKKSPKDGPKKDRSGRRPGKSTKRQGGDRVSGFGGSGEGSYFSPSLPFSLTNYTGTNIEVGGGEIRGGRIVSQLDNDWRPKQGSKSPIERFEVPSGSYLLHLSVEKLHPESWLGNLYGGMIDKLPIIHLEDSGGRKHQPIGVYAMAKVGGKRYFELIYLNKEERIAGYLPKFRRIKKQNLRRDYVYYFLFHIPSGAQPVTLKTGRTDRDLTPLNLVVPR